MKAYGLAFLFVGLILTAQVQAADPVGPPDATSEQSAVVSPVMGQVLGQAYPMAQMEPLGAYRGYYGTNCGGNCCGVDFGPLWASYCQDKHRCRPCMVNGRRCHSCAGTPCDSGCCVAKSTGCRALPGYYESDCDECVSPGMPGTEDVDIGPPPSPSKQIDKKSPKAAEPESKAKPGKIKVRSTKPVQPSANRSARRAGYGIPLRPMCW